MNISSHVNFGSFFPANEAVRPWASGKPGQMVTFCADDGRVYGAQWGKLSVVYNPEDMTLDVTAPPFGIIRITGPAAGEVCRDLTHQRATEIRTCHPDIRSVQRLSALEAAEAVGERVSVEPELEAEDKF